MAIGFIGTKFRTFSNRSLSHVSVLVTVVFLFSFSPSAVRCQPWDKPRLLYYRPLGKIRSSGDGVFNLLSTDNSSLLLFGQNLTTSTVVKLTDSENECDESGSLFGTGEILSANYSSSHSMMQASYYVTFPLVKSAKLLYFCLKEEDGEYYHQGMAEWLRVKVVISTPSWLPLPVRIIFILILMFLSGMFSGLNLGLMALDPTTLKIVEKSGTKRQKRYARTIYRVRRHGNYLLCTLLLGNVLVNSTFTILLEELISGLYAIIGSTLAIVLFGEIIPQAICSRYGLFIGANTIWLTYVFMVLTFPLSFPISLILNLILGKEIGSVYKRDQLLELLHVTQKDAEIEDYELNIISGALSFKQKTVQDVMTKYEHVFCIDIDAVLDFKTIKKIYDSGFSRIPIYEMERNNVVGMLYLRDLTFIDPEDCTPIRQIRDFYKREPKFVFYDVSLEEMLREFTKGQYHIAMVRSVVEEENCDPDYVTIGVVTLEDIIEEILGREINDEFDQFEDNVTLKPRPRKNMDIGDMMYTTPIISLSAHQLLAVKQFLSSAVPPFKEAHITKSILDRLLQQDIVYQISLDESQKNEFALYQTGIPASYFTLLLEGCLKVDIGKECLTFDARGFYFFGSQVLTDVIESKIASDYIPDFTVRPASDCLVLLITRQRYHAAYRASQFEMGKIQHDRIMNGRMDLFSEEWQEAESQDLQSSLSGRPGLMNIKHLLKTKPLQELKAKNQLSPNSKTPIARSPRGGLRILAHSPGPSRTFIIAEADEDHGVNERDSERMSLLVGMEGGNADADSVHNSRDSSPIVEVVDSNCKRTSRSLSDLETKF